MKTNKGENRTVNEKIQLIEDYLPEFMVKNAVIYNILSKGIHELEEECKEILPILQKSIELILDEEIAMRQKEKVTKEASHELAKFYSQNNNKKEAH
ncbi:hypothetical protein ACIQ57_03515 [Lysinibacillus xylanilyticus]|uniref:hypothetical protein n=1 Tax=Lysinibacillus xylanilyticus TaxID=582475 RepID=UPI003808480A